MILVINLFFPTRYKDVVGLDVALADIDGDGALDIVTANGFSNDISTVTR